MEKAPELSARLRAGFSFLGMNKEQKTEVVDQIATQLQGSVAVYAVDYRGLTVTQAAQLRTTLREAGTSFRVVKNTLTLRAADKAGIEALKPLVEEGPTALAFVFDGDPALAAKVLDTFARQSQVIELKGGMLNGEFLDIEQLQGLARLPSRDQLNAQLAGVVASPLTTLVRGLGSLLSGIAIALEQVRVMKETASPAHETEGGGAAAGDSEETASPAHETEGGGAAAGDSEETASPAPVVEAPPEPEQEAAAEDEPQATPEAVSEPPAEQEAGDGGEQQEESEPEKEAE
jgi:large subunit ribosomal protein L10